MKKPLLKELEHKTRRRLVLLDYPRSASNEVQTIKQFDKLFDGTVLISSSMSESDVRKEIADALHRKDSSFTMFLLFKIKILSSSNVLIKK